MLTYRETAIAKFLVATGGGDVEAISSSGEVKWRLGLAPGVHDGAELLKFLELTDEIRWDQSVSPVTAKSGRVARIAYGPGSADTGANPDYRPSAAATAEKQMLRTMAKLTKQSNALEKRMNAFAQVEKRATDERAEKVIEDETIPQDEEAPETDATASEIKGEEEKV